MTGFNITGEEFGFDVEISAPGPQGPRGPSGTPGAQGIPGSAVRRVLSIDSSATPQINTDNCDIFEITTLTEDITGFVMSGSPVDGNSLIARITDDGISRAISWGSFFESSVVVLPVVTIPSQLLTVGFFWNPSTSKWRCLAVA